MKRIMTHVSIVALLFFAVGCGGTGSDPKKDDSPAKDGDFSRKDRDYTQKDKGGSTDPIKVRATNLGESFRMDKAGADKRYQGKTLNVEGQIITLQPSDGKFRVVLIGDAVYSGDGNVSQPIDCFFEGAEVDKVVNLTPTQSIQLTAKYQGYDKGRVKLGECKLEKALEDPASKVHSTDLVKELHTDEQKAFGKYVSRYVVVDGKVVEGPEKLRGKNVFFLEGWQKGAKTIPVMVKGTDAQAEAINALKVGDTVKLKAKCRGRRDEVADCVLVEFFAWMK